MNVNITLPKPLAWQNEVIASPAKRKVIACGRRVGKTTFDEILAIPVFLSGGVVVYACPKQKQTNKFWREVKKILRPLTQAGYITKSEVFRSLELGEGRLEVQTAHDSDSIRGDYADLLILDEWQDMAMSAWNEVGAPMLLDSNGTAVFTFTPKRKNHAHGTYIRGLSDDTGRWQSWNFSSFANTRLSADALNDIIQDMTSDAYRQEILAEFLENEGAVFRNVAAAHIAPPTRPEDHANHMLVCGIDWGKRQDYTVISIVCRDCRHEVSLTRFNKIEYSYQRERLAMDMRTWNVSAGLAELNAMGEPNLEMLQSEGLSISGFFTTAQSKPPLIENLVNCVERVEYQYLPNAIAQAEMEAYEISINPATNRPTYSAPDGVNDDTVIARALATWQANRYMPAAL